jgi:rare lipoprotein A
MNLFLISSGERNHKIRLHPGIFVIVTFFFSGFLSAQKPFIQKGKASYYADKFEGRKTASGEVYHHFKSTAAHPTLPFGTRVKVTNLANNKSTIVRINDRGPFVKGRIIDLSKSAAKKLNYLKEGIAVVKIEVLANGKKNSAK